MPGNRRWKGKCDRQSVMMTRLIVDADEVQSSSPGGDGVHQRQTAGTGQLIQVIQADISVRLNVEPWHAAPFK